MNLRSLHQTAPAIFIAGRPSTLALAVLSVLLVSPGCSGGADPGARSGGGDGGASSESGGSGGTRDSGTADAMQIGTGGAKVTGTGGAEQGCPNHDAAYATDPDGATACQGSAIVRCDNGAWKLVRDCLPLLDSRGVHCHCSGGAGVDPKTQCISPSESCGTSFVSCPGGFPCTVSTIPRGPSKACTDCLSACQGLSGCCSGSGCICEGPC